MTRTELELAFDAKEDELNCCEAVLDAFVAELPEGSVETSFDCMGDYITAVAEAFKVQLVESQQQLATAKLQMEKQKDEWLAWEGKRKSLEQAALELEALKRAISDAEPDAWMHVCRKKPELRNVYFTKYEPALAAKGYEPHPLYTLKGIK